METLAYVFCYFAVALGVIMLAICVYNPWYCRVFLRDEWKAWEEIIPQLEHVTLRGYDESEDTYYFTLYNNRILFKEGCKVGIVKNDGMVLTWFDTHHNKQAVEILKTKI